MDNNEASSIVVSNDETSKRIKIDKNTKLEDFYQLIINVFPPSDNYNMNLFYYEGYSHEKLFVSTEKDYVKANKKGIEYFYFCSNNSNNNENYDYIKYYSVIIFSPIKTLNQEYQNEERKKMQLSNIQINSDINNSNNNVSNNINNQRMNPMMNNPMVNPMMNFPNMNPMMIPMMNFPNMNLMMNPMMNFPNINPMMNPMMNFPNMNPMMNPMINFPNMNPMMNPMVNPMMLNNLMMNSEKNPNMMYSMMSQLSNIYSKNQWMGLNLIGQINPSILASFYQNLENRNENNVNNNNIIINDNNFEDIPEYETIDTETNPLNKYIENAINMSFAMKLEISKEQLSNPEKFVNIEKTLSSPGLLSNLEPSNDDYKYILCLIGKILQNNGITVGIYKNNKIKDRIDLSAIQFIFSGLINKKKYKLKFNVNEYHIICITGDISFKKKFIDKWKGIIATKLNINKGLIILTNPRQENGKLFLDLAFNPKVNFLKENFVKQKLLHDEIIDCKMIPLLEACRLSPNIFDIKYHKYYNNNNMINNIKRRGGEEYLSPFSWTAYGINVSKKYDFGNNKWLGNKNGKGEFAVAYYGINNIAQKNLNMIQNIMSLMGNFESGKTFIDENNARRPGQKCKAGAYFYKNPNHAENSSETINIGGFEYKIMFMCRVNPSKIRQPENFKDCWILSPTPDEVRPYKILIKKIPKSPLAIASQQVIKVCKGDPDPEYFQILQNKDESFYNKKNLDGYANLSNYDYAIKLYSQASTINNYLRDPNNNYYNTKYYKSNVWCLHKAVTQNNTKVANGTILYRGVCFRLPNDIGVGTKFYFPEFLSTSRDINIAKDIAGSGTLMHITIQNNGTNGKKVYCRDIEYISDYPFQKEILFTSYCQFRITKIEKTPFLDIMHLTCEGHNFKD